jgi:hypothetical protein
MGLLFDPRMIKISFKGPRLRSLIRVMNRQARTQGILAYNIAESHVSLRPINITAWWPVDNIGGDTTHEAYSDRNICRAGVACLGPR